MALKKNIILDSMVEVTHHRIISSNIDWIGRSLKITVGHYVNTSARTSSKEPVDITIYRAFGDNFPLTNGGATQIEMYNYLKTLPEYEGATDEIID